MNKVIKEVLYKHSYTPFGVILWCTYSFLLATNFENALVKTILVSLVPVIGLARWMYYEDKFY